MIKLIDFKYTSFDNNEYYNNEYCVYFESKRTAVVGWLPRGKYYNLDLLQRCIRSSRTQKSKVLMYLYHESNEFEVTRLHTDYCERYEQWKWRCAELEKKSYLGNVGIVCRVFKHKAVAQKFYLKICLLHGGTQ